MLGRLRMSIDDAIQEYERLSRTIFAKAFIGDKLLQGARVKMTGARYDSSVLEEAFKDFIGRKLGDQNALFVEEGDSCKVYVATVFPIFALSMQTQMLPSGADS